MISLIEEICQILKNKNLTIATCESLTGGLLGYQFSQIQGASQFFYGALVTYHKNAKIDLAQVNEKTIEQYGTISPQVAKEMAINTRRLFKTDFAISTTGNASFVNPIENKRPGLFYIAICFLDKCYCYERTAEKASRSEVQLKCVSLALYYLHEILKH